jgi:hypothetical protein
MYEYVKLIETMDKYKNETRKYSRNSDYDSYLGEKHNPSVVFTADNAVNLKCTKTC